MMILDSGLLFWATLYLQFCTGDVRQIFIGDTAATAMLADDSRR